MEPITFNVEIDEDGALCAAWNDPRGGGISTFGYDIPELLAMVDEAVRCHFDDHELPASVFLHFINDPVAVHYAKVPA